MASLQFISLPQAGSSPCLVHTLLVRHNVRYKQIPDAYLPETPSSRITRGAFVFPGSRCEYSHVLYIAETPPFSTLLTVAYSKNTHYATADLTVQENALMKLMEANAEEPLAIWKMEERSGSLLPVLEMTLFTQKSLPSASMQELIWRNCGTLDQIYKANIPKIAPLPFLDSSAVGQKVKDFLLSTGFRKIKEAPIPCGTSYLVVLSSDEESEESKWKRFPLKIDVAGILAFRIYFSLEDAAVTSKGHFVNSAKHLIAKINQRFEVGYYNYASSSNQIQFTMKLHYKTLTQADLTACIKAYYEVCVMYYKWTAPALATLHDDTLELLRSLSDSEISGYEYQINEEMQEQTRWILVGLQRNQQGKGNIDTELLDLLESNEQLAQYLLEKPIYKVKGGKGAVRPVVIRMSNQLFPLKGSNYVEILARAWVFQQLAAIYNVLIPGHVFPTLSMIYYQITTSPRLFIVPNVGLHSNESEFREDILKFLADFSTMWMKSIKTESSTILVSINWDYFDVPSSTSLPEVKIVMANLGANQSLLYKMETSPRNQAFARDYQLYTSLQESLDIAVNPFQGWTEAPQDFEPDPVNTSTFESTIYYLCEQYNYQLWHGEELLSTLIQVAYALETLHSSNFCHWFVSPMTIRKARKGHLIHQSDLSGGEPANTALVLPCITPLFSSFISSIIPKKCHIYIAPEVKQYLNEGIPVSNIFAADVYSLCQVIHSNFGTLLEKKEELRALREVVTRGRGENPVWRPTLREVVRRVKELR